MSRERLEADLGNDDAWERYYRARDEVEKLRWLCKKAANHLWGDRLGHLLTTYPKTTWEGQLIREAIKAPDTPPDSDTSSP